MAAREQVSLLDTDQADTEARLQAMLDMMSTMGWKWFVVEAEKEKEVVREMLLVCHLDELRFLQGRADQLDQIIGFEDLVNNYYDSIQHQKTDFLDVVSEE